MKDGAYARGSDPDTAHEAADRVDATRLEALVFGVVRQHAPRALCVVEIHSYLPHLSIDQVSPRMKPLVKKGLIVCLGKEPRANRQGNTRNQLVYVAVDDSVVAEKVAQSVQLSLF